jgi:ADP-ribose pyrophosphatase
MSALYLYGTLRHLPLLATVLGRPRADIAARPAHLPDHRVAWAEGQPFPMILPAPGAAATGLVLKGLGAEDMARLDFYEGGFGYGLRDVTVLDDDGAAIPAQVYFPDPDLWTPGADWSLADWARDWGEISVAAAQEVMGYFGNRSPAEVAGMFPMIRSRAASRVRAGQGSPAWVPSGKGPDQVQVRDRRRVYANFFALDEFTLAHERFDGTWSDDVGRAVFILSDAALVLPYDPVNDRVLLVDQMRAGPLARGDSAVWQLEPVAGRVDPGETPEQAARREAKEEAGLTLDRLEPVAQVYASPSCTSEYYYIYVGLTDLPDAGGSGFGVAHEGEDIATRILSFDALMDLVDRMGIANAPLAVAALWLARARDRLRAEAAKT